jgi:hypothetical protein
VRLEGALTFFATRCHGHRPSNAKMVGGTHASLRTLVVIAVGLTVVIAGGCEADVCADPLSADVPFHYRRSVEPDALARGFGVAEFALMRDPETSTYQFEVPRSASLVTCALLVGSPQISTDPARIANAATIMPRVRGYETRGGEQLALQVGSLRYADANEGAFVCSKRGLTPFMVEGLWLGCWASNGVRITGATELVALELDDVPQSQSAVASCLGASLADTADRLCPLDAEFGVCAESRCVPGTADAGSEQPSSRCSAGSSGRSCVLSRSPGLGRCRGGNCVPQTRARDLPADQLVIECGEATDGFSCRHSDLGVFGTCFEGSCRRRCSRPDTEPAVEKLARDQLEPSGPARIASDQGNECRPDVTFVGKLAEERYCRFAPNLPIGVCVEQDLEQAQ